LITTTPNGDSSNISTLHSDWSGFNPFHINIFSKNNLSALLLKHGFQVEQVFSCNNACLCSLPDVKIDTSTNLILKNIARKLQIFILSKDIRFALLQRLDALHREEYLKQTVDEVNKQHSYFSTPDSKDELAENCKGDNIVFISRKIE
jgi:hypothetical protein